MIVHVLRSVLSTTLLHLPVLPLLLVAADANAANPNLVADLPGYGPPDTPTFAGYVDAAPNSSKLYYMAFEAEAPENPDTRAAPLLVWLNGGPGASSFLGNFLENGPYKLQPDLSFQKNAHAWNQRTHIVYFDNPVGTGFSHCTGEDGKDGEDHEHDVCEVKSLHELSADFYNALLNFLQRHPQFGRSKLWFTGESFAGQYVPHIADYIRNKRAAGDMRVPLAGVLIGNPGLDMVLQ